MALITGMPSIDIFLVPEDKPVSVFATPLDRQRDQVPSTDGYIEIILYIDWHFANESDTLPEFFGSEIFIYRVMYMYVQYVLI